MELASRAYSPPCLRMVEGSRPEPETIPLPALPAASAVTDGSCPRSFKATLVASQLCSDAGRLANFMQYGVWYVEHMGYVVAFRGSEHGLDWLCNLKTGTLPLQGPRSGASAIRIHEGIYERVLASWSSLVASITRAKQTRGLDSLQEGSRSDQQCLVLTGEGMCHLISDIVNHVDAHCQDVIDCGVQIMCNLNQQPMFGRRDQVTTATFLEVV